MLDGNDMEDGVCFYEVAVFDGDRQWAVRKRYQEFAALNKALHGLVELPPFPPKSVFRNRFSAGFRNKRYQQLDVWLRALLAEDPCLSRFDALRKFFGLQADDVIPEGSQFQVKEVQPDGDYESQFTAGAREEQHELLVASSSQWTDSSLRPWCQSKCGQNTEIGHMSIMDSQGLERALPLSAPWTASVADLSFPILFRAVVVLKDSFWLGSCRIIHDGTAVMSASDLEGSDIVDYLSAGCTVTVVEVSRREDLKRVRGKLAQPPGWITLEYLLDGYRWAIPEGCGPENDQDDDPLERRARASISKMRTDVA